MNTDSPTQPASGGSPAPAQEMPLLKLRDDLVFTVQSYGDQPCYLVEDPVNGSFFRIGVPEYKLLQHLNGEHTLEQALDQVNSHRLEDMPLLEMDVAQPLAQWLVHSQLAYMQHPETKNWQLAAPPDDTLQKVAKRINVLFIKLPLGSPDRWLERLYPKLSWMLGARFFWVWLLLVITGTYQIASHSTRFAQAASSLLSINNAVWLLLAWVFIKTIHEFFHGLVCKKYGGFVHEAGIFLILFAPLGGYVNATSMWRFTSRWQRMHVSVAGMFIELLIAAIAAWVWVYSQPGMVNYLAYNMIIIAGIGTLLFNANPLMRFDGYYVLSDGWDIPNLYASGQRYMRYLWRRYLQGRTEKKPDFPADKRTRIQAYGIASWLWRILIMLGLLVAATLLFHGAGVVIATIGLVSWLALPALRFLIQLNKDPQKRAVMKHLLLVSVIAGALLAVVLLQVQWSRNLSAPALLDYADATVIRADSPGFIKMLPVKNGDYVQAGEMLLQLQNHELEMELQDLALQLKIHELKRQQYFQDELLSAAQVEQEKLQELETKYREIRRQVEGLKITASVAGHVIAPELEKLQDAYVSRGMEILTLGNLEQIEVNVSIAQNDIDYFRAGIGNSAEMYTDSQPLTALDVVLERVNPAASQDIMYPMLTAVAGGDLAVKPKADAGENDPQYEHLSPRFSGVIQLSPEQAKKVHAGERAQVLITTAPQPLWNWLSQGVRRYFKHLEAISQG
ncbi:efflux RND transporter periplasmic adaptor subunit [Candidatus Venteria ishoeyi]|uniref:efflux RND transporter periplasmic adaptor subunit n=1 Tax=Candidatus Venteria ishoeyi TaxID=1899563 RepID=UPI0025A63EE2|nr:efflux RND transporter periplasmic adaptor subunit [Candidatus Venteria ishoeyi]MDM8545949.1 efflux RND transporter periplasmic adaptor subunit [Candidatus Venteria ishoeyi]